jgi:hypothetical protein
MVMATAAAPQVSMSTDLGVRLNANAMVFVEEQVKAALKNAEWGAVKVWRGIGSDVAKQLRLRR